MKKKKILNKIKFDYLFKRKFILGIFLVLVFICGAFVVYAISSEPTRLEDDKEQVENTILAKCPYTLDELEEAITSGWLFDKYAFRDYGEEVNDVAYVLFHFYDYFSKDTKITVVDEVDANTGEFLSYKKISYDEYMENRELFFRLAERSSERNPYSYGMYFRSMMYAFIRFV